MTRKPLIEATAEYLARRFVNAGQLGTAAGLSGAEVESFVRAGQLPQPSYTVADGRLVSVAFGELDGEGLASGTYFHAGMAHWLDQALAAAGAESPGETLKTHFIAMAGQSHAHLAAAGWVAPDCTDADGNPDPAATAVWLDGLWRSHLGGIFGVCVRQPERIDQIVLKETMQAMLMARTGNGVRTDYTLQEADIIRSLVDRYAVACSDFTPVEYPISSRRRYLEGLRLPQPR